MTTLLDVDVGKLLYWRKPRSGKTRRRKLWTEMLDHPRLRLRNGAVLEPMNHYELKPFGRFGMNGDLRVCSKVYVLEQYMLDVIAGQKGVKTAAYRIFEDEANMVRKWLGSRHVAGETR